MDTLHSPKHRIIKFPVLFFQTILLTFAFINSASALTIWRGSGEVIRGPGQGKIVELIIEEEEGKFCIRKGPSQGNCIDNNGKTPDSRIWKVSKSSALVRSSGTLRVILYTLDEQVVDFKLN
jgi:hypothetical protein